MLQKRSPTKGECFLCRLRILPAESLIKLRGPLLRLSYRRAELLKRLFVQA